MKKLKKINKLQNVESFVQVSYLKGFKYIDKAGEIINLYQKANGSIAYDMSPERIIFPKGTVSGIEDIKVSNTYFWCHFVKPMNLGKTKQTYLGEFRKVSSTVEHGPIVRVGWRNYFVYDIDKTHDVNKTLPVKDAELLDISFKKTLGKIKTNFHILPLEKESDKSSAILFDIDMYIPGLSADESEASSLLEEIKNSLESSEMLDIINEILDKV